MLTSLIAYFRDEGRQRRIPPALAKESPAAATRQVRLRGRGRGDAVGGKGRHATPRNLLRKKKREKKKSASVTHKRRTHTGPLCMSPLFYFFRCSDPLDGDGKKSARGSRGEQGLEQGLAKLPRKSPMINRALDAACDVAAACAGVLRLERVLAPRRPLMSPRIAAGVGVATRRLPLPRAEGSLRAAFRARRRRDERARAKGKRKNKKLSFFSSFFLPAYVLCGAWVVKYFAL